MENEVFWRVMVTYGTCLNQTYARVPCRESAEKLKALAVSKGYDDARVVRDDEAQKIISQSQGARHGGAPYPRRAPRSSR